jgi:hypothetical protein
LDSAYRHILLIKLLKFASTFGWSLSNFVAFLSWNVLTCRDLWESINNPFHIVPLVPEPVQYTLPLPIIGGHS